MRYDQGPESFPREKLPGWHIAVLLITVRQQSIRNTSRLLDTFVDRALRVCKNHERGAKDLYLLPHVAPIYQGHVEFFQ